MLDRPNLFFYDSGHGKELTNPNKCLPSIRAEPLRELAGIFDCLVDDSLRPNSALSEGLVVRMSFQSTCLVHDPSTRGNDRTLRSSSKMGGCINGGDKYAAEIVRTQKRLSYMSCVD